MKRFAVLPLVLLAFATACTEQQQTITEPSISPATVAASFSASPDGSTAPRSTICVAYDSQLVELQEQSAANPNDADLAAQVTSFEAVIADACN